MCLIFVAYRLVPGHRLVVAANRDEFHHRPSAPAGFWDDRPEVLAGRDLEGGGTWLGVSRGGRFAALTNFRSSMPAPPDAPTRGALVRDFLVGVDAAPEYLEATARRGPRFNGFSLLVFDGEQAGWCSNRGGPPQILSPGLYGLSNHLLDTPWPKVESGKRQLSDVLGNGRWSHDDLLAVLADDRIPDDDELPSTGVDLARERELAPLFIRAGAYGTRCSTAVSMDDEGAIEFVERSFDQRGAATGTVAFSL